MWHEKAGYPFRSHLCRVSVHESQLAEAVEHLPGHSQVYVPVGYARTGEGEGEFVAAADYVVDVPLPCAEASARWVGPGEVGGIVCIALDSGVNHHKLAFFDDAIV